MMLNGVKIYCDEQNLQKVTLKYILSLYESIQQNCSCSIDIDHSNHIVYVNYISNKPFRIKKIIYESWAEFNSLKILFNRPVISFKGFFHKWPGLIEDDMEFKYYDYDLFQYSCITTSVALDLAQTIRLKPFKNEHLHKILSVLMLMIYFKYGLESDFMKLYLESYPQIDKISKKIENNLLIPSNLLNELNKTYNLLVSLPYENSNITKYKLIFGEKFGHDLINISQKISIDNSIRHSLNLFGVSDAEHPLFIGMLNIWFKNSESKFK